MTIKEEQKAILSGLPVAAPLPNDVNVSFEFFPPKSEKMEETLWASLKRLEPLGPQFVSVTYGAGGTTRERTHNTVVGIQKETSMTAAAHLTCVGSSKAEIDEIADRYWEEGIRHIVALRGDPAEGDKTYTPHPDGYAYAVDLVEGLKKRHDFEISVAGYPENHPEAPSEQFDLDYLKRKVDAGANRVITQYFFEAETFLRYRDKAAAAGVTVPIIPGILPVTNFKQVLKMSDMCATNVPAWMADLFSGLDEEPETRKLVAATVASELCRVLHANGVKDFHFYTLNRADLTYAFCHVLGVRPKGTK
ncbi:5,10-methylenetetrahydrofolate reductase [Candidatus Terasakiella magnetica]|uniref:Methylenetetrahydrofolate reductase n=1 Tax=Candidatus Terasakiella magnetica TaxID=1867952 RepID=A0A1C3RKC8_9PROT|nr:5,10-methylenetetrahydrofolate reductase [Candidatus Terasakiella magnetica]